MIMRAAAILGLGYLLDHSGFHMSATLDAATPKTGVATMHAVLRPAPRLTPEDSLLRLLQLFRQYSADSLPVTANGRLAGMACHSGVAEVLAQSLAATPEETLLRPVRDIMCPATRIAHPDATIEALRADCLADGLMACLPVVDADGYCLGIVHPYDLFIAPTFTPRLPTIGGMATPFGVYLTDGTIQAGVGNLALIASGAMTASLLVVASELAQRALFTIGRVTHVSPSAILDLDYSPPLNQMWYGVLSLVLKVGFILLFLILMRLSVLAGYHAAEHQTVHALEAGERLAPEIVRRMPRAHPRCGTNLMAALMLFSTLRSLFDYIPATRTVSDVLAAAITLFLWRRFGTLLQQWFTTRAPSVRQTASGIAAGDALLRQYTAAAPARVRPLRRLWCMGLVQSLIGMLLMAAIVWMASLIWPDLHL